MMLSREGRMRQAAKIIDDNRREGVGRDNCEDSVANMLDWLEFVRTGGQVLRRASSKETKREIEQFAAWLRKGKSLVGNLHLRPLSFKNFRDFRDGVERMSNWYQAVLESWLPGTPKPRAHAKRFAAEAALHLCDEFGMKPSTTRGGAFRTLAAVLYGDRRADLQKHCQRVLAPDHQTMLARTPNRHKNCSGSAP
jgi:hypothetical protein